MCILFETLDRENEYPLYIKYAVMCLDQLLLLEEALEMVQLPSTRRAKDNKLKNSPSHNPCIRRLGLITELCLPFLAVNTTQPN